MSTSTAGARARHHVTAEFGMWAFLATEMLFFGGLFTAYTLYRFSYPHAFDVGAQRMEFGIGTVNTALLLISSVFVAIADRAVRAGRRRLTLGCLATAFVLGLGFLALKGDEYHSKAVEHLVPGARFELGAGTDPAVELFFFLYFALTGLHAAHMVLGLGALAWLFFRVARGRVGAHRPEPVAVVGLYWHFVDCIWVFLYPLFYLPGR